MPSTQGLNVVTRRMAITMTKRSCQITRNKASFKSPNEAQFKYTGASIYFPMLKKIFHTQTQEPTNDSKIISHVHWPTKDLFIVSLSLCLENR